jgi:eukaryotic-like serine/threonine-protein kinase
MFKFITDKPFWVNLLAAAGLGLLIIFILLQLLGKITRHGEHLTVPSVIGSSTDAATKLLQAQGFDVAIQDSVYTDTLPRGTVLKQLPDSGATVKVNRTVFLTVNCLIPPMVTMPDLKDKDIDFATVILKKNHLQLGGTIYRVSPFSGSVLDQLFQGQRIDAGTPIQWGSSITLVVATAGKDTTLTVPDLMGKTYQEAKGILDSMGIMAEPIPKQDVQDTLNAIIYKQDPLPSTNIKSSTLVDLWLENSTDPTATPNP